ncbi:hypothetical protein Agub_g5699, partial [Astrephomene gubernaculifera]
AFARCLGRGGKSATAGERDRAEARLPSLINELTHRLSFTSFQQLTTVIPSLAAVITVFPRLRAPPATTLGAALVTAARNATSPPTLPDLEVAFSAILQIYTDTTSSSNSNSNINNNRDGLPSEVRQQLCDYLRTAVVEGPGCTERLRRDASMTDLAAAVALVEQFKLQQPTEFVKAVTGRVDELIQDAYPRELETTGLEGLLAPPDTAAAKPEGGGSGEKDSSSGDGSSSSSD